MIISTYSFITAIFFFSVSIVICEILKRKNSFLLNFRISVLLCLIGASVFRLLVPIETSMTFVVGSDTIFPIIVRIFTSTILVAGLELSFGTLLLFIWGIGSLICLFRIMAHTAHDKRVIKSLVLCSIEDSRVNCSMERVIGKPSQKYKIIISHKILTPMVTGLFSPIILLPQMVINLSDEHLYHILIHEWNHVLNKDLLFKWLIEILCCVMWWNPVVYLLKNNLGHALEIRCDYNVTKKMDKKEKKNYLETILLLSKNSLSVENKSLAPLIFANFNYVGMTEDLAIKQRFNVVRQDYSPQLVKSIVLIVTIISLLILSYSVVLQPYKDPPANDVVGTINVTPENSYILVNPDGTYELIHNGLPFGDIPEEFLSFAPYNLLPIIHE